jgi:hypothetical protein
LFVTVETEERKSDARERILLLGDVLRSLLGEEAAAQAIESMRAAGLDPATMGEAAGLPTNSDQLMAMVNQMQAMLALG